MEVTRAPATRRDTFGGVARWKGRISGSIGILLAVYILFLSNIVVFRHPIRFDLTEERLHSLSPATLEKLRRVQGEIQVVIPTFLRSDLPEHLVYHDVLSRARLLLNEYIAAQPLIKIVAEVDVLGSPERWEDVRARYDLDASQVNRFIFISAASKTVRQTVTPTDLATFKATRDPGVNAPEVQGFRGEKAITDALSRIISGKLQTIYFSTGHGELLLRPGEDQVAVPGLRAVLHELETEGMQVRELSGAAAKDVPPDCALLLIVGPSQPFSQDELSAIDAYLQRGGHLLATLWPRRTGLEDLLKEWGVEVLDGQVQGKLQTGLENITTADVPVRSFARAHPATKVFQNVPRFEMQLAFPRPLVGTGTAKGLEPTPLLAARSEDSLSFYRVEGRESRTLPQPGDFDLAVAVEQRAPSNPPPGFQKLDVRLLVVGSSSFLSDQYFLRASHRDFLMSSVAWLLGDDDKATVSGQEWSERVLRTSPGIEKFLFWFPVFILPGVFLCAGAFVYYMRRA